MATPVLTRSYDNGRTGANLTETILTPDLIASKGLSRMHSFNIFNDPVQDDPRIEAQPLYVPNLQMPDGKIHNVLFVATMANKIWAFDVDGNGVWQTPVLGAPYRPAHDPTGNSPTATVIDSWGINLFGAS